MIAAGLAALPIVVPVPNSTNIASFAYLLADSTLSVTFKDGATYSYMAVPLAVFEGFVVAPSKGSYHHRHIRGSYAFTRSG